MAYIFSKKLIALKKRVKHINPVSKSVSVIVFFLNFQQYFYF